MDFIPRNMITFFFGGHLIDVHISDSKMEHFLQTNKSEFEELTNAFLKKL